MLIGVVVFDLQNQYFSDVLTMIENQCTEKGYSTVVMFTDKKPQKEINCIENLYNMSVDGIVLCPINQGEEFENFLLSLNIPIVTIGNSLNKIPYVGIDNTQSMKDTVQFVKNKGYNSVVYVMPNLNNAENSFAQSERLDAFSKTADEFCLHYIITDVRTAISAIMPGSRTALICPTDIYAICLYTAAKEKGAGIIGFDNTRLIDWLNIPLDSVSYDVAATARTVVSYIIDGQDSNTRQRNLILIRPEYKRPKNKSSRV